MSEEVRVEGRMLMRTHADFEHACLVKLAGEQRKPKPDSCLIALLCDAVRVNRECVDVASNYRI